MSGDSAEKAVWTDSDFEVMGWHDVALHSVALEPSLPYPGRVLFDVDYIVEWVRPEPPSLSLSFWISPATLVFDAASDLVGDMNLTGFAFEPSLDALIRSEPDEHGIRTWTLDGHQFRFSLKAKGFVQYLRRAPILSTRQRLTLTERDGTSFNETGFMSSSTAGQPDLEVPLPPLRGGTL